MNWHQTFILKSNFNLETSILIYVIISSGCNKEYIGQTTGQLEERLSFYRQHIQQTEYEKIEVERHLRTCAKGKNKILRECYENNFIKKFKPELNRRL